METSCPAQTGQVAYFQYLRAAGAAAVVFLHMSGTVYTNVPFERVGVARTVVWEIVRLFASSWAVPCFFMVSGALMLSPRRQVDARKCLRHVRRMVFVLLTFGFAFCVLEEGFWAGGAGALSLPLLGRAAMNLLSGNSWGHLWFVYTMIGLYLLTPLLRPFVREAGARSWRYLLGVLFLLALAVPTVNAVFGLRLTPFIRLPDGLFYYLLGSRLDTLVLRRPRALTAAGLLCAAVGAAAEAAVIARRGADWFLLSASSCPLIAVYASAVFLGAKRRFAGRETGRAAKLLADCSFGVFIVHPAFYHICYKLLCFTPLDLPPVLGETVFFAGAMAFSLALALIFKKLPVFRRYL